MNTETALRLASWVLAAFLSGSVPWGWLIGRIVYGEDIRKKGSGNIGFTNVHRLYGWIPGLICFLLDVGKGFLPVFLAADRLGAAWGRAAGPEQAWTLTAVALAAGLGHTFTPWLRFKGGKGIATALGVFIAIFGWYILIPLAVFLAAAVPTRYISLGSIWASLALAAMTSLLPPVADFWPLGVLTAALVLFTHRQNIKRLIAGTESRFGAKSKSG